MNARTAGIMVLLVAGCRGTPERLDWGLERMIHQPSYRAYEVSDLFADGSVMRTPPPGTLPYSRESYPPGYRTGRIDGVDGSDTAADGRPQETGMPAAAADAQYVDRFPLELTMDLLRRGRDRYDIYCAVCHGMGGNVVSAVATRMTLRPPASLHEARIVALPVGRLFEVVTDGYGMMPGYAAALPLRDRWAVVAYVRALQLRPRVRLETLPDSLRRAIEREGNVG
jgi:mono/diheme cytochrome c family protein